MAEPEVPVIEAPVVEAPVVETPPVEAPVVEEAPEENWDEALEDVFGDDKKTPKEPVAPVVEEPVAPVVEEAVPQTTAQIVREALREADVSRTEMEKTRADYQKEIIDTLYPEGVDRQLADAEGNPIRGVSDLKKLINPNTDEYFTGDEAAEYLLEAQQKLNKELADFDGSIGNIIDTQISIQDGAKYVKAEYGELLKALPDIADRLQKSYFKNQLVLHPKSGIILGAKMPIEEFYDDALAGYKKMASQLETQNAGKIQADAKAAADAAAAIKAAGVAAKTAQSERADITQNGTAAVTSKEDDEWDEAFTSVLGKRR